MRNARLGIRPRRAPPSTDAVKTITVVMRYKQTYVDRQSSIEVLRAWADSWDDRKNYLP
jgi:hypothetical protein